MGHKREDMSEILVRHREIEGCTTVPNKPDGVQPNTEMYCVGM